MRYLAFDIECCDGKHICEFGYAIADEQFNVLAKECILMNPEAAFNLTGRSHERDLTLTYSEEQYRASPNFIAYYDKIKQIIKEPEQVIIGFSMKDDANFLNTACRRYDLNPIEFDFCDVQRAYTNLFGKSLSLGNTARELELSVPERLHESSEDALLTMEVLKQICNKTNIPIDEIFQNARSMNFGGDINKEISYLAERPDQFGKKRRRRIIKNVAKLAKPQSTIIKSQFTGKVVCFSSLYEQENPIECINLFQQIINHGGKISFKSTKCTYYVKHECDDENDIHSRYYHIAHGLCDHTVKVVTFDELLVILNINKSQLNALSISQITEEPYKQCIHIEESHAFASLGEIVRKSGIAQ